MFCGEYEHVLDEKNRLIIPAKFRAFIAEEERQGFFLLRSPVRTERCLRMYTPAGWRRQADAIRLEAEKRANPVEFYRLIAGLSEFVPADTQSRVVLPQKFLADLELGREVLMLGVFHWIEVWDPKVYRSSREAAAENFPGDLIRSLMPVPPSP